MVQMRLKSWGNFDVEIKDGDDYAERFRKWEKEHPDRVKKSQAKYYHTKKGKIAFNRKSAKRRKLRFVPLNEPFNGAVAHHIDKEYVIYIPEELHRSIPHNTNTGKGMREINAKAINQLIK